MLTLGLDTATSWGSVGLYREGPLGEISCRRMARRNDPLVPSLQRLFETLNVDKSDLELIAVALGPGSFTSLRVGVSLAKGLALALNVPVVGVASLPLFAGRGRHWHGDVCALITDRPTQAYVAWSGQGQPLSDISVLDIDALQQTLQATSTPVLMIGPGANSIFEAMVPMDHVEVADETTCQPSGIEVARQGIQQFKATGADDLAALEPLYSAPPAIDPSAAKR